MAATKEQKERKTHAEHLLAYNGVDYDEWLDEKHQEVITEGIPLLIDLLKKEQKSAVASGQASHNS
jgi:hypothetical protein